MTYRKSDAPRHPSAGSSPDEQGWHRVGMAHNPQMSVDLIVRTPKQVGERLAMQDSFMREILERGT